MQQVILARGEVERQHVGRRARCNRELSRRQDDDDCWPAGLGLELPHGPCIEHPRHAYAGASVRFSLRNDTIEKLLARASTVLDRYSSLFAAETFSTNVVGRSDFQFIFSTVAEAVERGRAETQALLAKLEAEAL